MQSLASGSSKAERATLSTELCHKKIKHKLRPQRDETMRTSLVLVQGGLSPPRATSTAPESKKVQPTDLQ
eukprot:3253304-Pleurochrysis_carterae.AAC.2